jgi:hypothetical protein
MYTQDEDEDTKPFITVPYRLLRILPPELRRELHEFDNLRTVGRCPAPDWNDDRCCSRS